jgi:hypothetical protein
VGAHIITQKQVAYAPLHPKHIQETFTLTKRDNKMPRLVTPSSNPHVHGSHTLMPYSRRQRLSTSPVSNLSSSDKENAGPVEQREPSTQKISSTQAAFREKLGENSHSQFYEPYRPKDKERKTTREYRRIHQEVNGNSIIRRGD